jgi:hypothetical protein
VRNLVLDPLGCDEPGHGVPPHRILDPQGRAALEDIAAHPQLGVLLAQPSQLHPLVLTERALTVPPPILGAPIAQRALIDPELSGHLRDRLTGLAHQPHRTLLEVLIELPACCHRQPP